MSTVPEDLRPDPTAEPEREVPGPLDEAPSMLAHVSIGTNHFEHATAFYDAVLRTLGVSRLKDFPGHVGYGRSAAEFWISTPIDGRPASVGNGTHFAFLAQSRGEVDAFYAVAIASGGTGDGPPGPRPHYGAAYYACFVRDLDGHKIEAMVLDAPSSGEQPTD